MESGDHGEDHLEKHSLPGTDQAGTGPDLHERDDHENRPGGWVGPQPDQLEKHSLPGTTQAGKGPASCETNDTAIGPNGG